MLRHQQVPMVGLFNSTMVCIADDRRPVKVLLVAVGILALSGATAGLLGIGGALIFNPYLLQLGMDPRVRQQIGPDVE